MKLFLACLSFAFAHGESRPGPHGGFIRMPGPFHTEVVHEGQNLKVYLLDMDWNNPSVRDSSLRVSVNGSPLDCRVKKDAFVCPLTPKINMKAKGKLVVDAKREGAVGNSVTYALPLQLEHH